MKETIKLFLRESLNQLKNNQLSSEDKEIINYILGDNINEANGREMYARFLTALKKGAVSAAAMSVLMSTPAFSAEIKKAPDNVKDVIAQITKQSTDDSISSSDTQNQDTFEVGKDDGSEFSINLGELFKSGSYNLNVKKTKAKLAELKTKIAELNLSSFDIVITASESQVPNQSGFGVGELAKKRASVMKKVLDSFLSKNGLDNVDVDIQTRVGDVKWDGKNAHDAKYTKDQYVKLDLYAAGVSPCELNFSEEGEVASAEDNYISYEQELDSSGALNITPGSIPDRMVITNDDGQTISDTGYFADAMHQYEQFNYVPLYVANLSEILHNNPSSPAVKGLESTTKRFNDFNELLSFMLKDKEHNVAKDRRGEVRDGYNKLKKLWQAGQRDFIFYTTKKGTVKFDVGGGNAKMTVYSPIGRTGFGVKGACN